jgi:hypothetical protein
MAMESGEDIGDQAVFDAGDFVFQLEFALFQPLQLQLFQAAGQLQAMNDIVQVAMLQAQVLELAL